MNLRGKLVLITGAGRGIGLATAIELSRAGARIIVVELDAAAAEAGVTSIEERGGKAWSYVMDVSDRSAVDKTISQIEEDCGPLDIVINNAGIMLLGEFMEHEHQQDIRQMEVNFFGVVNVMRSVLPYMEKRGRGHIVNIASLAGKFGVPYSALYSASKHAVIGLTESIRGEYLDSNIHFSYVMPGVVETELFMGATKPKWPPMSTPQDVAVGVRRAIEKRKVEVFVPRLARFSLYLRLFLPQFAQDKLSRVLNVAEMFRNVDRAKRQEYVLRAMVGVDEKSEPLQAESPTSSSGNGVEQKNDSVVSVSAAS